MSERFSPKMAAAGRLLAGATALTAAGALSLPFGSRVATAAPSIGHDNGTVTIEIVNGILGIEIVNGHQAPGTSRS